MAGGKNAKSIFLEAIEKPVAERASYLDEVAGEDIALRDRVEALLAAHDNSDSFLQQPGAQFGATVDLSPAEPPLAERPGALVGPYKLLEQIGEGGMGVVYMAEQQVPIRRRVALKVIKVGMDTRQVIARFEAERQALALMDHSNIARVLDAGTTDSGRPYFVMELVRGVPITEYCDHNNLPVRERLELFVQVCHAVQHAHQKGIIHRDIKPSNVLVTVNDGRPVPKVIDFGVAKATNQQLTEKTLFTAFAQMVGTPLYMSPEQAEMSSLDIDTRSDIYSLGVLLYELLTGTTPFDQVRLRAVALAEMVRIICEEEPPKPSTRISTLGEARTATAAHRQIDAHRLGQVVEGDLDWIVMRCLEKDRQRRYDTASALGQDIERHLADEPVEARPPSALYRLRKFARRNKRALATGVLLGVMLLVAVGVVAASFGWMIRDRAGRQMVIEEAAVRAMVEADEFQKHARWQEALAAVERAQAALASGEASAELQQRVSNQLVDLRMIERLDELRSRWGDDFDQQSQNRAYTHLFADFGIDVENLSPAEIAERIRRRPSTAAQLAAGLDDWSRVVRDWGVAYPDEKHDAAVWKRLIEAARFADPDPWRSELRKWMGREDVNALRKLADSSDVSALSVQSLQLMGCALIFGGDGPAAVAWLRRAHRQHPADTLISFDLAFHLRNLSSDDRFDVLRFAEAALATRPHSAPIYNMVGLALEGIGRHDEAVSNYRRALELNPLDAVSLGLLGLSLDQLGRHDEAIACDHKAIQLDPKIDWAYRNLADALSEQGKFGEAIATYGKAIELKPNSWEAWAARGDAYRKKNEFTKMAEDYGEAIKLQPERQWYWRERAYAYMMLGQHKKAVADLTKAIELVDKDPEQRLRRGRSYEKLGEFQKAADDFTRAVEIDPKKWETWVARAEIYRQKNEFTKMAEDYGEAIKLQPERQWYWHERAYAYAMLGQHKRAIADLSEAIELGDTDADQRLRRGFSYDQLGDIQKADDDFSRGIEIDPTNWRGWQGRAKINAKLGKLDQARADLDHALELCSNNPGGQNELAWTLVADPTSKLHNPKAAVELAKGAVAKQSDKGEIWNTLGVAHYRAGDWQGCVTALMKSMELQHGGDSNDWFFLAMAHWQLNDKEDGHKWYHKAIEWMDKNQPKNDDLVRFRHEADQLFNGNPVVDVKAAKRG